MNFLCVNSIDRQTDETAFRQLLDRQILQNIMWHTNLKAPVHFSEIPSIMLSKNNNNIFQRIYFRDDNEGNGKGAGQLIALYFLTPSKSSGFTFPFSMGQRAEMPAYRSSLFRSLKRGARKVTTVKLYGPIGQIGWQVQRVFESSWMVKASAPPLLSDEKYITNITILWQPSVHRDVAF